MQRSWKDPQRRQFGGFLSGAALACLLMGSLISPVEASHFRFGHITWRLRSDLGPRTVEITVTHGWRTSAFFSGTPSPGDTLPFSATFLTFGDSSSGVDVVGTVISVDSANDWFLARFVTTHTYATDGPFTVSFSSCCRIYSLVNASGASFTVSTQVDLRGANTGSPVSSAPAILQMGQGGMASVALPVADPDGDPFACRMATSAESDIPAVASAGGNTLAVSSGCVLTWDTSATSIGQLYAVQVIVEENRSAGTNNVALDFIIEISGAAINQIPTCTLNGSASNVVNAGQSFSISMTGDDPDGGTLSFADLGLPAGATLTPPSGSSGAVPLTTTFSWTPAASDAGSAQAVTVVFSDPGGLQATCAFSIQIPLVQLGDGNGDGVLDAADLVSILAAIQSGNTLPQHDVNGDGKVDRLDIVELVKRIFQ